MTKHARPSRSTLAASTLTIASAAVLLGALGAGRADDGPPDATIDAAIDARLALEAVEPAPVADDATFLRRVWLDVAGTVPGRDEAASFLDADAPDRAILVDRLLDDERFARHWGRFLLELLTGGRRAILDEEFNGRVLYDWLVERLREGDGWNEITSALLQGRGQADQSGPANFLLRYRVRPAAMAATVGRAFLGVSIECAQCHDHPYDDWTQEQFWGVAAFFARTKLFYVEEADMAGVTDVRRGRLRMPPGGDENSVEDEDEEEEEEENEDDDEDENLGPLVRPRFLDGTVPSRREKLRASLARLVVSPEASPTFARAFVNRVWARLLGRGLIDPVDDVRALDAASHPELLDGLTARFIASGYDIRKLVREIVLSRAYQRRARPTDEVDPELFAAATVRPLSVDQLFQSVVTGTGFHLDEDGTPHVFDDEGREEDEEDEERARSEAMKRPGREGGSMMGRPGEPEEGILERDDDWDEDDEGPESYYEDPRWWEDELPAEIFPSGAGTLRRSLAAMNGEASHHIVESAARFFMRLEGKPVGPRHLERTYLALLARRPSAEEQAELGRLIERRDGRRSALEDIIWAVLNSAEFRTNH